MITNKNVVDAINLLIDRYSTIDIINWECPLCKIFKPCHQFSRRCPNTIISNSCLDRYFTYYLGFNNTNNYENLVIFWTNIREVIYALPSDDEYSNDLVRDDIIRIAEPFKR